MQACAMKRLNQRPCEFIGAFGTPPGPPGPPFEGSVLGAPGPPFPASAPLLNTSLGAGISDSPSIGLRHPLVTSDKDKMLIVNTSVFIVILLSSTTYPRT